MLQLIELNINNSFLLFSSPINNNNNFNTRQRTFFSYLFIVSLFFFFFFFAFLLSFVFFVKPTEINNNNSNNRFFLQMNNIIWDLKSNYILALTVCKYGSICDCWNRVASDLAFYIKTTPEVKLFETTKRTNYSRLYSSCRIVKNNLIIYVKNMVKIGKHI